jgi:hypothetical protein
MHNFISHAGQTFVLVLVIFGQVEHGWARKAARAATRSNDRVRGASPAENLPPAFAADLKAVDSAYRSIRVNQSPSHWQLDTVRWRYESILKRASGDPAVQEAVRERLDRVDRDERSAKAAQTIESILAESHLRDREVAADERRVAAAARAQARAFNARGFVQESSAMIEGRKLYILIANDGSTIAYLDIPPGLDIDPLLTHRVGVRGEPHFNEDLGARLISVRDVEQVGR